MEEKIKKLEETILTLDKRLDAACGSIHALEVITASFIVVSRDLSVFVQTLPVVEDVLEAQVLPVQVSDTFVESMRETFRRFDEACKKPSAHQSTPPQQGI